MRAQLAVVLPLKTSFAENSEKVAIFGSDLLTDRQTEDEKDGPRLQLG